MFQRIPSLAAAEAVAEATDGQTKIIPGHGPVTDRATVVKYGEALRMARDRISERVQAGDSEEDVAADYAALVTGIGTDIGWSPDAAGFVNAERFVRLGACVAGVVGMGRRYVRNQAGIRVGE